MTETPRLVLAYRAILAEAERLDTSKRRGSSLGGAEVSRTEETDSDADTSA